MNTLQEQDKKTYLFEAAPIPSAVAQLAIPTILSSLVMVLYNLADTYFVGMLNDPVQNAAVTLAAPVLLAFNAVNNLFGVGSSSLMSRSLGCKDYDMVSRLRLLLCALLRHSLLHTLRLLQLPPADPARRGRHHARRDSGVHALDRVLRRGTLYTQRSARLPGACGGLRRAR